MTQYQVMAGLLVTKRGNSQFTFPEDLSVGLLTLPPKPEGGGQELSSLRGYQRQPLKLRESNPSAPVGRAINIEAVRFDAVSPEDPHITHVGIFDACGELLFYGLLDGDGGRRPNGPIEFKMGRIALVAA